MFHLRSTPVGLSGRGLVRLQIQHKQRIHAYKEGREDGPSPSTSHPHPSPSGRPPTPLADPSQQIPTPEKSIVEYHHYYGEMDPRANRGRTVTILPDRGGSPSGKADGLGSHGSMSESSVTDSMSEPKFSAAESTIDYDDDTIGDEGPSFPVSSSLSDMWDESLASKGKKNYSAEKKKNEFGPLERFWKFIDWAAYFYYNERKSSFTDLAVIAAINISMIVTGGLIKASIDQAVDPKDTENYWDKVWAVLVLTVFQDVPDEYKEVHTFVQSAFAIAVAIVGVAGFALVLALIEQGVLESLERNVKKGGRVYEKNHVLVLGWAKSQLDLSVLYKILQELCLAYRNEGGRTVVVLTGREKLELEELFGRTLPMEKRYGTNFVFRQGNPLKPDDLRTVSCSQASSIIVISDLSRSELEADSQNLRTAVLIDELDYPGPDKEDPRKAHVVVQLMTQQCVALMNYTCSRRIIPFPSGLFNARRLARMVKSPVVANITTQLFSFASASQGYMHHFPALAGTRFQNLPYFFPDATILGVVNPFSGDFHLNPTSDYILTEADEIMMMRPTNIAYKDYKPSPTPQYGMNPRVVNWRPPTEEQIAALEQAAITTDLPSVDIAEPDPLLSTDEDAGGTPAPAASASAAHPHLIARQMATASSVKDRREKEKKAAAAERDLYFIPLEYLSAASSVKPMNVAIFGWSRDSYMYDTIRELDHGLGALPDGSEVTFFCDHSYESTLGLLQERIRIKRITLHHIRGNPLSLNELARLDVSRLQCALIMCDKSWMDTDDNQLNGMELSEPNEVFRVDAMIMMLQLNIRKVLEERGVPPIHIISEKLAFEGVTRFEDRYRLPLGVSVNFQSYAAKLLTECAYDPSALGLLQQFGKTESFIVIDAAVLARPYEELTYWDLMGRATRMRLVLVGYFQLPKSSDEAVEFDINPATGTIRSQLRVWNRGDARLKLIVLCDCENTVLRALSKVSLTDSAGAADSLGSESEEDGYSHRTPRERGAPTAVAASSTAKGAHDGDVSTSASAGNGEQRTPRASVSASPAARAPKAATAMRDARPPGALSSTVPSSRVAGALVPTGRDKPPFFDAFEVGTSLASEDDIWSGIQSEILKPQTPSRVTTAPSSNGRTRNRSTSPQDAPAPAPAPASKTKAAGHAGGGVAQGEGAPGPAAGSEPAPKRKGSRGGAKIPTIAKTRGKNVESNLGKASDGTESGSEGGMAAQNAQPDPERPADREKFKDVGEFDF